MSVGLRLGEDLGDGRIAERTLQGPLENRVSTKGGDSHIVQRPAQGSHQSLQRFPVGVLSSLTPLKIRACVKKGSWLLDVCVGEGEFKEKGKCWE